MKMYARRRRNQRRVQAERTSQPCTGGNYAKQKNKPAGSEDRGMDLPAKLAFADHW